MSPSPSWPPASAPPPAPDQEPLLLVPVCHPKARAQVVLLPDHEAPGRSRFWVQCAECEKPISEIAIVTPRATGEVLDHARRVANGIAGDRDVWSVTFHPQALRLQNELRRMLLALDERPLG